MRRNRWIWMPHPAHFCCADRCKFVLSTYVGKYIVSTVGELVSNQKGKVYETVSRDYLYETMVFKAGKSDNECCPYRIKTADYGDMLYYNTPEEARKGHIKLCNKWSKK